MKGIPAIKSVMTPFPYSVGRGDTLETARALMAEHRIRHLPVMDGERLASVVGEREIDLAQDARSASSLPGPERVGDIALRAAYVVELTEPLDVVLARMADDHLDCAVVVKEGKLAGIFTTTDACRAFATLLGELFPRGGGDEAA
jgi:acetoin utilization protein AcuB